VLLIAQATFSDGSTANISELVEWHSSNTGVARVTNVRGAKGKVTARSTGRASISVKDPVSGVTSGQSGGNASVQVIGKLKSLKVTPSDRKIDVGQSRSMKAEGTYSNGTVADVTEQVSWSSSDPGVAVVSNESGKRGRVTAVAPGTTQISVTSTTGVTSSGTGGDAQVRVPSVLVSIAVTPNDNKLPIGLTVELQATGTFNDGSTDDITSDVAWTVSNSVVASVGNDPDTKGEVTALALGTTLVSVTDPVTGISSTPGGGDALVTVAGTLVALTISPTTDEIPTGLTHALSVKATLDDASSFSLSRRRVAWGSSNTAVATVGNDSTTAGVVTGVSKGTAVISAAVSGVTSTASGGDSTVTVLGRMVGLAVRPKNRELFTGATSRFSAVALLDDGSEAKLSRDVTFSSSETAVATISNKSGTRGDAFGVSKGRATISVTHTPSGMTSSSFSGDATATVRGRVEGLRVDPKKAFYVLGTQPKVRARATFDDGSSANIGSDVTWTSTDPSIAEVGNVSPNKGVLFAKQVGKTTLSAVEPVSGVNTSPDGDGRVTIVDGLLSLRLKEGALEMRTGDTFGLEADGLFPNPTPDEGEKDQVEVDMTDFVELTSSNPAVIRIVDGQALAVGLGDATVSAHDPRTQIDSNQSNGNAVFKVIAALQDIKLKPRRITVKLGSNRRRSFQAMGFYTDKAKLEVTDKVDFETSNGGVAQVSNDADRHGLVLPVGRGATIVTAVEPITGVHAGRPRRVVVKGKGAGHAK
jgi:hypothetical protein